jgi:regulatory protein SWI5
MLVSPSGNIQKRSRGHRRQISIPVALEAANSPNLPAAAIQRYSVHKRGSSLDQRAHLIPKDSYTTRHPNVLRETQQQQQQHMSRLNQPYFDHSNIHMSSNTDYQQLGPGGLNVFTNPSSNENIVNYACMDNGSFDAEVENMKYRQNKPATGLDNQLLNEESWNSYAVSQSGLPQVYDLRRMSVQSDLSQHSYTPSTPPKQMHTSKSN